MWVEVTPFEAEWVDPAPLAHHLRAPRTSESDLTMDTSTAGVTLNTGFVFDVLREYEDSRKLLVSPVSGVSVVGATSVVEPVTGAVVPVADEPESLEPPGVPVLVLLLVLPDSRGPAVVSLRPPPQPTNAAVTRKSGRIECILCVYHIRCVREASGLRSCGSGSCSAWR